MAQNFTSNSFAASNVAQTDLQNMENNFLVLQSNFSGSTAPSNAVGGMMWAHAGNVNGLRIRNYANSAWLAVLLGDASSKLWLYRNDAGPGMVVDTSLTDRVLSIKGGSNAYNVSGGATGGTWTQPNHTHSVTPAAHVHQWYKNNGGLVTDQTFNSSGTLTNVTTGSIKNELYRGMPCITGAAPLGQDAYTTSVASGAVTSGNGATAATWRPAAAVGTLQYPSLT
jgi:hypothetical protein